MKTAGSGLTGRSILAIAAVVGLLGSVPIASAHADDRRHDRAWYEHERREHEWREHRRVYYGERVYVTLPPPVYYAPPPPPPGLNLMFSFGR